MMSPVLSSSDDVGVKAWAKGLENRKKRGINFFIDWVPVSLQVSIASAGCRSGYLQQSLFLIPSQSFYIEFNFFFAFSAE